MRQGVRLRTFQGVHHHKHFTRGVIGRSLQMSSAAFHDERETDMTSSERVGAWILMGAGILLLAAAHTAESRAAAPAAAVVPGAPTVIVYDQPNFKGNALTISAATPDLAAHNFDNKVASLTIANGGDWVLCENKNYTGRCVRVQSQADNLNLLQLHGRVSSLYPVPATPAAATP